MIPKILHFIWIGDETKRPDNCIQSWIEKNPSYQVKIWGNSTLTEHKWMNAIHMDAMLDHELCGVADMMRLEILYQDGGIVVDADSICFRGLEDWMLDFEAFSCWENEIATPGLISSGYLGSIPRNDFFIKAINNIKTMPTVTHEMAWKTVGRQKLTELYRYHQYQSLHIFPSYYFIPQHHTGICYNGKEMVYALQLWGSINNIYNTLYKDYLATPWETINQLKNIINNPETTTENRLTKLIKNTPIKYIIDALKSISSHQQIPVEIFHSIGKKYSKQGKIQESIQIHTEGIKKHPNDSELHLHQGLNHSLTNNIELAIEHLTQSALLNPKNHRAHRELGQVLFKFKLYKEAFKAYQRSLFAKPDQNFILTEMISAKRYACDWDNYQEDNSFLIKEITTEATLGNPFVFLNITDVAQHQFTANMAIAKKFYKSKPRIAIKAKKHTKARKIKIGYLSSDYKMHATMTLAESLFELHDRTKFEVIGLSIFSRNDSKTSEIKKKFDGYHEYHHETPKEIAERIQNLDLDILIDLKGYTGNGLPEILIHHPAPIQVNYLGFPGTVGGYLADYIIGDWHTIPEHAEPFFSEKVVRLPNSYQINNNKRPVPTKISTRADHGLPPAGFIFCCFNSSYKLNPPVFAVWMNILRKVPNSVLWLLNDNEEATKNIKMHALEHGIDPNRLVFADHLPSEEHLERHHHIDLVLDTHPINAHTTASDALWMGVPVLTQTGHSSFASRVAASLLHAVGLADLVVNNQTSYEDLAIKLANDPGLLACYKQKLLASRLTCSLFNSQQTTRAIEAAFQLMHARHQAGLPPTHINISESD